jgi:hypothetical protein
MNEKVLIDLVAQCTVWLMFCGMNWALYKHGDLLSDGNIGSVD